MEFNKPMDVSAFDWDDSALIKAFDRAMKAKKSSKSKESKSNKENAKDEKAAKLWEIGDYCRAIYQEDGLSYEATIIDIQGDYCTVEFLGYGDYEEVSIDSLEDSLGKKARQKQRKSVKKIDNTACTSDTDYSYANDSKNASKAAKSGNHFNGNYTVDNCDHFTAGYAQHHPQANFQQHSAPPQLTYNPTSHAQAVPAPLQRMGGATHCLPPPPPPPMPPCSAAGNDPALSAMLISWYMAGYYTGLHQNQKSSHCSAVPKAHCCDRRAPNHCGHYF